MANEKRLIDVETYILCVWCKDCEYRKNGLCEPINNPSCDWVRAIFHCPTVDAVPVIRCRHCKHCEIVEETQRYFCGNPLGSYGCVPVKPEDFCSYAKPKDGAK